MSVSYTHLDVYKRQVHARLLPQDKVEQLYEIRKEHGSVMSVSYTHLDVYKRQI